MHCLKLEDLAVGEAFRVWRHFDIFGVMVIERPKHIQLLCAQCGRHPTSCHPGPSFVLNNFQF